MIVVTCVFVEVDTIARLLRNPLGQTCRQADAGIVAVPSKCADNAPATVCRFTKDRAPVDLVQEKN